MPFQQHRRPFIFLIMNHESREKYVGSYVRVIQYYLLQLSWHSLEPATYLRWTVSLVQQKNLN
jgi:hypothetical protein